MMEGLGLVIVDVVTDRHSHWQDELLKRLTTYERTCREDRVTA
jgi:hypothetical protein